MPLCGQLYEMANRQDPERCTNAGRRKAANVRVHVGVTAVQGVLAVIKLNGVSPARQAPTLRVSACVLLRSPAVQALVLAVRLSFRACTRCGCHVIVARLEIDVGEDLLLDVAWAGRPLSGAGASANFREILCAECWSPASTSGEQSVTRWVVTVPQILSILLEEVILDSHVHF